MGKKAFIIYPGRYQIFHKGHKGVYTYLTSKYGGNDVYISTTDKVELPKSPFTFNEKKRMMLLTGIPSNRIINVVQNYNLQNLIGKIPINIDRDFLIFAVSEKDMAEDPRFSKFTKRDGSPTYLQLLPKKLDKLEPAVKHAYIDVVPTTNFTVLGMPARSASQLRNQYSQLTQDQRKQFITDLFGKYDETVFNVMNDKLGTQIGGLTENQTRVLKKLIMQVLREDEGRVKDATKKTYIAMLKQRELEKRDAEEKLKLAQDALDVVKSPEEKDTAEAEVDLKKKNVKSKDELLKAAKQQVRSAS